MKDDPYFGDLFPDGDSISGVDTLGGA
ncbi:hypothetical protein A2U01_0116105, partial [Trifolium medium]|nr:hypothetical protein [Trifolium medium]